MISLSLFALVKSTGPASHRIQETNNCDFYFTHKKNKFQLQFAHMETFRAPAIACI